VKFALAVLFAPGLAAAAPISTADVTSLTAGWGFTCTSHSDGAVSCWGANDHGQLGDGTLTATSRPTRMTIADVAEVSADGNRTCVRRRAGTIACFGKISPANEKATTPVEIPSSDAVQLEGSCWRTTSGAVSCLTNGGQVVALAGITDAVDVAAGNGVGCVARKSGTVACWFDPNEPQPIPRMSGVVDVALAATMHVGAMACARTKRGDTACWQWGFDVERPTKRVPRTPPPPKPPKQLPVKPIFVGVKATSLAGGRDKMCAATARDVQCWDRELRRPTAVKTGPVVAIAADTHYCALRGKRDVACWGAGDAGQLGFGWSSARAVPTVVPGVTDAVELVASYSPGTGAGWTCARKKSDAVVCWGNVRPHQTPGGDPKPREVWKKARRITRGMVAGVIDDKDKWLNAVWGTEPLRFPPVVDAADDCAITRDDRVVCSGEHRPSNDNFNDPKHADGDSVALVGLTGVKKLAMGGNHACALKRSGHVVCFPERGKILHESITDASDLAAGQYAVCAVRKGGTVWCKGQSGSWLLKGEPMKTTGNSEWMQISGLADVVEISLGTDHGCARTTKNALVCWGNNDHGELGDGTTKSRTKLGAVPNLADVAQVSAGARHTCALRTSGEVLCWGEATTGQVGSYTMADVVEPQSVLW
jgi:alpha-tubulin suppressor-like RCC1 family protein